MPRSLAGVRNIPRSPSTYSLPPGTTPQQPNSVISSSMFNAFADDVAQTFNTVQPIAYGGTGVSDLKLNDTDFGIKDNADPTKIGQFNASGLPTATTRTYDLPYYSGTLGLVSDIRGQIYGLTLSNNVTDATNDIDIAAGAAVDNAGAVSMLLAAGLTKQLDAVWAVGNNAGMRASGAAIANTTYFIFLIRRPDTGVVDIAADTSVTGANIAANTNAAYTQIRRIGAIMREGGIIVPFIQNGDKFRLVTRALGVNGAVVGTTASTQTLVAGTVPNGISLEVEMSVATSASGTAAIVVISALDEADTLVGSGNGDVGVAATGITTAQGFGYKIVRINTSRQVRMRAFNVNNTVFAQVLGWVDTRGQQG